MLTTEEMRLKLKSHSLPVDSSSSSPLVLMTDKGMARNPTNPQVKSWKPCINYAKGACRYGAGCKFVHDNGGRHNQPREKNSTKDIVLNVLSKLGITGNQKQNSQHVGPGPTAYYTSASPTYISSNQHRPVMGPPPGFSYLPAQIQLPGQSPPQFTINQMQPTVAHPIVQPNPIAPSPPYGTVHQTTFPPFTTVQ